MIIITGGLVVLGLIISSVMQFRINRQMAELIEELDRRVEELEGRLSR